MQCEDSYKVRQAMYKSGRAHYDQCVKHFEEGNIIEGRISSTLALTLFKKVDSPYIWETEYLERCITYLDSSEEFLPFVIDVLNLHEVLPNRNPEISQAGWAEKRAGYRLTKSMVCLEKNDLETGIRCAKESVISLCDANELHKGSKHPDLPYSYYIKSNEKDIRMINTCIQLLSDPDQNLSFVIDVFKRRDIVPDPEACQASWTTEKARYILCKCIVSLKNSDLATALLHAEKAYELFNEALNLYATAIRPMYSYDAITSHIKKLHSKITLLKQPEPDLPSIKHSLYYHLCEFDKYLVQRAVD